jgi:hypothetical protein
VKRYIPLITFSLSLTSVMAGIDDKMVGTWSMIAPDGQPLVLNIGADGRFATTTNGFLLESGKMDTENNRWSIKSDVGRLDRGTFALTDDGLQFTSETTGTSKWSRSTGVITPSLFSGQRPRTDNRLNSNPLIRSKVETKKRSTPLEPGQTPGFSSTYGGVNEYHGAKRVRKGW